MSDTAFCRLVFSACAGVDACSGLSAFAGFSASAGFAVCSLSAFNCCVITSASGSSCGGSGEDLGGGLTEWLTTAPPRSDTVKRDVLRGALSIPSALLPDAAGGDLAADGEGDLAAAGGGADLGAGFDLATLCRLRWWGTGLQAGYI